MIGRALGATVAVVAAAAALEGADSFAPVSEYSPHREKPLSKRTGKSYKDVYGRLPRRLRKKESAK